MNAESTNSPSVLRSSPIGPVAAVSDIPRARAFYEEKLGLVPGEESSEEYVPYACGEGSSLMVYLSPDHAGKATATLAGWLVPDVDTAVKELTAAGVTFEQYDLPGLETDERGVVDNEWGKVAFFRDPDGNTFAVNEAGVDDGGGK